MDVSTGGLDVDGQTDLDELQVAGVSTFSAKAVFNTAYPSIDADNEIQVGTAIQLGKAGVITATSFSGDGSNLTGVGTQGSRVDAQSLTVSGISTFNDDVRITAGGLNVTGVVTAQHFPVLVLHLLVLMLPLWMVLILLPSSAVMLPM